MKENDLKTQKKSNSLAKKIINVIINILIVIVLIISLLIAVMSLSSKSHDGTSVIFGYSIENIQTNSMKGGSPDFEGGDFEQGDIVIGKYMNYDLSASYQVGDIVTYKGDIDGDPSTMESICHRIIEIGEYNGFRCYRTKGDNNEGSDQAQGDYAEYITSSQVASVVYSADYHCIVIKGFGKVLNFLQTKLGFFLCVLLPMIIFFIYELIRVVFNAAYYRKAKDEESHEAREAEKQEAINAAVAAALAKDGKKQEDKTDTTPEQLSPEQMEQFKQFMEYQKMQDEKKQTSQTPSDD